MDEITHPVAPIRPPVETPLRSIMREQGRTQKWLAEEVAKRTGRDTVDYAQISDYCRGVHLPQLSTRLAIAQALGRHHDDIFPAEMAA
jgi:transcriptional regulator with XRE-family HTH domain